jgi:hypothetical protein
MEEELERAEEERQELEAVTLYGAPLSCHEGAQQ